MDVGVRVKCEFESMCVELFSFVGSSGFGAGLEEGREGVGIGVKTRVEHLGVEV